MGAKAFTGGGPKKTVEWYLSNESWWRSLTDENVLHHTPWKL